MIYKVELTQKAKEQLEKVPIYVVDKLQTWIHAVQKEGFDTVQKIPTYQNLSLEKKHKKNIIKLNQDYFVFYSIKDDTNDKFVIIEEVYKNE